MSFEFDAGGGGSEGPWLSWTARGTLDGDIPAKSFILRDTDGKKLFTGFDRGVVLDIDTMKTGWSYSDGLVGVAPTWVWNSNIKSFAPKPGEGYKRGFSILCAISKTDVATWEQSGQAAWTSFVGLVPALANAPAGKLPMVKLTGTRAEKYARGSTIIPILEVVKWVDRPECLKDPNGNSIDVGNDFDEPPHKPAPAAPARPAPKPVHEPEPEPVAADGDDEF